MRTRSGGATGVQAPVPARHSSFVIVAREELWAGGRLQESRLLHGRAEQRGDSIEAIDTRDDALALTCDQALHAAQAVIGELAGARVRVRVRATREDGREEVEATLIVSLDGVSVVTSPADAPADFELLRTLLKTPATVKPGPLPIVWRNGSGAVVLHEAFGHAAEHEAAPVVWPDWLLVEAPLTSRRETFRDIPISRMKYVAARQRNAPFALPEERIEVLLVAGGAYDPLTDVVTIDVAISTAGPFRIERSRAGIAASLLGASGEPARYPGVICSREGQSLFVASSAPVLITGPLR